MPEFEWVSSAAVGGECGARKDRDDLSDELTKNYDASVFEERFSTQKKKKDTRTHTFG